MLEIERSITKTLKDWAKRDQRKVLLLRGARQVGKTFVCRQLGRTFKSFVEVNLVEQPLITRLFEDQALSIDQLISSIAALAGKRIIDGETLLFIDEIQASREAIERLRFFYERRPNLHVIATGSLLEFALEEVGSFGVGRIENLFMHPLTFEEVLLANGAAQLLELIRSMTLKDPLPKPLHEKALNLLRQYLIVGGLPEAQAQFIATKDLLILDRLSSDLLTTYEDDFAKYHKKVPAIRLRDTLRAVAFQSGKKFIYSHAYRDAVSKEVHSALDLLSRAGLAHKIHHTAASGVPLGAQIDPKTFKVIPHDIGLFNQLAGLKLAELLTAGEIHLINKGALVEVFVGLELLAHGVGENNHRHTRNSLFYWHREAKSSNAELDYVLEIGREIIPLEVKASGTGAMRSMRVFLKEKEIEMGIRVSAEPLAKLEDTLVLPLYALSEVTRLWLSGFAK